MTAIVTAIVLAAVIIAVALREICRGRAVDRVLARHDACERGLEALARATREDPPQNLAWAPGTGDVPVPVTARPCGCLSGHGIEIRCVPHYVDDHADAWAAEWARQHGGDQR